ncbi:hypothetical protein [Aliiruegeria lutimaris]|uniref:Uncharacterized protein n=1 Tax=Aliiruegeria lutimaris TaxID=571298 RepID=A0A1G8U6V9_9RHOB|nr:hypothetical protein [Aliiruegeria lutimaris]SDJ49556.1 hypothetical protein SAMN04488026_101871 [Aliiruegeria lutimaris]
MSAGQMAGLVDVGHMSVKTAYVGVFISGVLLGIGWALAGCYPGTGPVAAASGRRETLAFMVGGLLGTAAYMATYPSVKSTGARDAIAGGSIMPGAVPGAKYEGLTGLPGDTLGIAPVVVFIVVAFMLPERNSGEPDPVVAE